MAEQGRVALALLVGGLLLASAFGPALAAQRGGEQSWTVVGCGRMRVGVLQGTAPVFILHGHLTGPVWKGGRLHNLAGVRGGKRVFEEEDVGFYQRWWDKEPMPGQFDVHYELSQAGPREFRMTYECVPDSDTTFGPPKNIGQKSVTIGPVLRQEPYFAGGKCTFTLADGQTQERVMPVPMSHYENTASVRLETADGEVTRLRFDPPLFVHCDHNELRCFSGSHTPVKEGETFTQQITLELPRAADFEPANRMADMADWFPLEMEEAEDFATPDALDMRDWLDTPAGSHGYCTVRGKDFVFEDGTPVKFWGVNQCCRHVCPEPEDAVKWADKWAKHGVNLVRMHKFIGHGWKDSGIHDNDDTQKFDQEMARRWDNYNALLAERGIYTGWSQFYGLKLTPADKDRVWAYDEIMKTTQGPPWYHATTIGLVNFAPDLQDLHISIIENLLNRVNTVTGKRYADSPSLAYIEIQNEDDIFFGYTDLVNQCPTYKKYVDREFSEWLLDKYGTREELKKAWGDQLEENENPADGTVAAFVSRWKYGADESPRIQDAYAFLYKCQDEYYKRVVKAIHETGYRGAICGSCWQAQTFLGHLYNVRSDREVGFIDRHNYGGGDMLRSPGRSLLSAGMQQVADRPFALSEWAGGGVYNGMEMVPVIGFIGMGVQGWDMSAHFASGDPGIGGNVRDRFMSLSQYPAVQRAVYRGDLEETDPVAARRVGIPAMADNSVGFSENFSLLGGANIKEFSSVVPQESLGVGPVVLELVDGPVDDPVEHRVERFIDRPRRVLRSASGQVRWDYSGRGYFTLDTPGTQGFVGFGGGSEHRLSDVTVRAENPLAFIYVSAKGPDETIADASSLVITAVGRMFPEGSVMDEVTMNAVRQPENPDAADQMIEPVVATVELKRDGCRVFALDHGGRMTDPAREVPVQRTADGCRFTLDGARYDTMYYIVQFR
mgnify:FL=1